MMLLKLLCLVCTVGLCVITSSVSGAWGFGSDRVSLNNVKVLSLYNNKMTQGRRSSPVPQLKCIGGSAGCSAFQPQVVQCYNRGSDGYDVQWECKTDMDNSYRFGQIEVSCEGYDHADDEYVLKGSCGLEYTLDLTKEGMQSNQHQHQRQHSYYGDDSSHGSNYSYKKKSSGIGDWITLAIIGVIIYGIYRSCIATSTHNPDSPDDGHPRPAGYGSGSGSGGSPPAPGFRPGYGSDSCSGSRGGGFGTGGGGSGAGGGGFWSGAATGGMLGYLFGSRGNRGYGYGAPAYGRRGYGTGGVFGGGGGGYSSGGYSGGGFGGFGGGGGRSSGTRTASGFGGTRRR